MTESTAVSVVKGFVIGVIIGVSLSLVFYFLAISTTPDTSTLIDALPRQTAELVKRIDLMEGKLSSQSHAMMDVAYHFANLWFAAEKENWPLAAFYLGEMRQHLRWAVRIVPVRKDSEGNPFVINGLVEAFQSGVLVPLEETIKSKDPIRFKEAYNNTIEGCYSCHKTSGKPFLRPKVPDSPPERIIEFSPEAKWPQ